MARTAKPWRRKGRAGWWAWVGGKLVQLTPDGDHEAAQRALYRRLVAAGQVTPAEDRLTVVRAVDLYLDHSQAIHRPTTWSLNRHYLQTAVDAFGRTLVTELRPSQVEQWLAGRKVSSSTRRIMLASLRAAMGWCRREGYVSRPDCLKLVKMPRGRRRDRTLSPDERRRILESACPELRQFLVALTESGARPFVLRTLEARHIDWEQGTASLTSKGRPYVIVLTAALQELLRGLAGLYPDGPLFRGPSGHPWTVNSLRCQMRRLRARTGITGVSAYTYRHSYATDALERGLNAAMVAALLNQVDLNMIAKHYGHLADRRASLRAAAELAAEVGRGSVP